MSKSEETRINLPLAAALVIGLLSGLVVGSSFYVINYWPLPASVAPMLNFESGFLWGFVTGAITGFVLGFLTDEKHFQN